MPKTKSCSHEPCRCQARISSNYCSEACEKGAAAKSDDCMCGHKSCAASEQMAERIANR